MGIDVKVEAKFDATKPAKAPAIRRGLLFYLSGRTPMRMRRSSHAFFLDIARITKARIAKPKTQSANVKVSNSWITPCTVPAGVLN